MSGEKKFGTSVFGFNKSDVNAYIEKILNCLKADNIVSISIYGCRLAGRDRLGISQCHKKFEPNACLE